MKQEKTQLMYCIQCEVAESPSNKPFPECPKCGRAGMRVKDDESSIFDKGDEEMKKKIIYCDNCGLGHYSTHDFPSSTCANCDPNTISANFIFTDKSVQLENNVHYLQRRLKEWRFAFWAMFFVAMGFFVAWVFK
jgi:Zn finger protein HypA/HybF involved in hydrogenase expression